MIVDDAIKFSHILFYNQNWIKIILHMTRAISRMNDSSQFGCLVSGIGKLLPSPKAVADPLPKHRLFGRWTSPVQLLSMAEAVADPV